MNATDDIIGKQRQLDLIFMDRVKDVDVFTNQFNQFVFVGF
jgi:hypothetical protein